MLNLNLKPINTIKLDQMSDSGSGVKIQINVISTLPYTFVKTMRSLELLVSWPPLINRVIGMIENDKVCSDNAVPFHSIAGRICSL